MADFVESAKSFVSAAVSRTSWEAQKQLRVRNKQSEVDKLLQQRQQLTNELTQAAMSLYIQGALHDPQLSRLCASILELDNDIKTHETKLQEIKSEQFPAEQFTPAPTTNYAPPPFNQPPASPPPSSAGPNPAPSARPNQPPKPGQQAPGSGTGAANQSATCPNCGNPIRPGALYCRSCGAKLR
ncbi:MAG TPA: zinc ribbon domain-containing protein [Ktedonobacteraceae bacterium]|nr:zinc ribbon domain-containing protein [Ktedonobacteraceae bacterium]